MKKAWIVAAIAAIVISRLGVPSRLVAQAPPLATPGFHHLHLNSVNPEGAIDFYAREFPSTSKGTFAGQPALKSPNNVWVLFTKVATPPATMPPTAFWHFGWHVTDVHKAIEKYLKDGVTMLPLYVEESGGTVFTSADTWPGTGGALGLTAAGIAEAKAKGVKPTYAAGFSYLRGPDDAMIEAQGNMPAERFNHIHMWQEQPFCAQLWYQKHLNLAVSARGGQPPRTEANCSVTRSPDKTFPALDWNGMFRTPSVTSTTFSDVSLFSYMNQWDTPLVSTRGHLMDHFGLSVPALDPWIAKLRAEGVKFLEDVYQVGDYRAVMIEGPSREAIEIVEIK